MTALFPMAWFSAFRLAWRTGAVLFDVLVMTGSNLVFSNALNYACKRLEFRTVTTGMAYTSCKLNLRLADYSAMVKNYCLVLKTIKNSNVMVQV